MRQIVLTLLIVSGVILTVIADVFLKKSAAHNVGFWLLGLLLYAFVAIPVAFAFRMTGFGNLFLIWEAVTVVAGIIVATVLFEEAFTIQKFAALILVIAGLVLSYGH